MVYRNKNQTMDKALYLNSHVHVHACTNCTVDSMTLCMMAYTSEWLYACAYEEKQPQCLSKSTKLTAMTPSTFKMRLGFCRNGM